MRRRKFIEFVGKGSIVAAAIPSILVACNQSGKIDSSIFPSTDDELKLADGLDYHIVIKEGDFINDKMVFGTENDYVAYLPISDDEGILWVNHEMVNPMFASGYNENMARHIDMINSELHMVGGSIVKVRKEGKKWSFVKNDPINNRLTAATMIPFEWPELVAGNRSVRGTLANCSGGITPWGTILTCEENYDNFYGEIDLNTGNRSRSVLGWERFFPDHLPQHYGWVVEVDISTGAAKKHVGLGRMAHECATVTELKDGRVVIYTGDDQIDGCIFKYISDEPGKIYPGKLYVANTDEGKWEWLDISRPELAAVYEDQTEVLIRARESSLLVGGTKQDRPEDIEIDPLTGDVLITLTNNKPKGNYHGSILKIMEGGDYDALSFESDTLLTGGEETGFSSPDNMAFDAAGNLWFCSDISDTAMNKPPYEKFGNNGLYVLVRNGEDAGKVFQVASAPTDAEFTGPFFAPDGETLFLSVQHPGEGSKDLTNLTSHWPNGGTSMPQSAVVAIQGSLIKALQTVV
jgi:secreted PhoX family phosphatase